MKNFIGFVVLAVGVVLGIMAITNISNGAVPIYWGLLAVALILVFAGYKIMKS